MADGHVCAGVQYQGPEGGVHSDLCAEGVAAWDDPEYRKLLHDSLDELLNTKDTTGLFFVGVIPDETEIY